MKFFRTIIAAIAICGFANDCFAGNQRRGVELKCFTPIDVLHGTGIFIKDTGKNVVEGVHTTVEGLGELITAPFRARICVPQRRFRYVPPRIHLEPAELYEIKPPAVFIPPKGAPAPPRPPAEVEGVDDPLPLRYLPAPSKIAEDRIAKK